MSSSLLVETKTNLTGLAMVVDMKSFYIAALTMLLVTSDVLAQAHLPEDVGCFISRRDICDHLRGEISDNPSEEEVSRVNESCKGTDSDLDALYRRYERRNDVMDVIKKYDRQIEAKHVDM